MTYEQANEIFDNKGEEVLDKLLDYVLIEKDYDKASKYIMDVTGCEEEIAKAMVVDTIPKNTQMKPIKLKSEITCPYCQSTNTTKITTTSKAVNTVMFGLLGTKRHKQWHCNNCKSDF